MSPADALRKVPTVLGEVTLAQTQKLWDGEQVFKGWSPRAINVESASLNNGITNVTTSLTATVGLASQGKTEYTYSVDAKLGLASSESYLSVTFNCGPGTASVFYPVNGDMSVPLSCSEASIAQRAADAAAAQ